MKIKPNSKFMTLAASALLAVPVLAFGGAANPPSGQLLNRIAFEAQSTVRDAAALNSFNSDNGDWSLEGGQLMLLRTDVNTLSRDVQKLQSAPLAPGEQRLVARVADRVNTLAGDTQDAILFGRAHPLELLTPHFEHDVSAIYSNSEHLRREVHNTVSFLRSTEKS